MIVITIVIAVQIIASNIRLFIFRLILKIQHTYTHPITLHIHVASIEEKKRGETTPTFDDVESKEL
jgi:hypothetical protein